MVSLAVIHGKNHCRAHMSKVRSWDLIQDQTNTNPRDAYLLRQKSEDRDERVRPC
jgi:hypothetical protein